MTTNTTTDNHSSYDVIIVGAGIIGPTLSVALADQGKSVLVVERDLSEPNRIVGELMQPGGLKALKALGFESAIKDIDSIPVNGYEIIYHGNPINLPYTIDPVTGKREEGRSFHHGRFVMKLREKMLATPGVTVLEAIVTDINRDEDSGRITGVTVKNPKSGSIESYTSKVTVIADGTTSKFRKDFIARKPIVKSNFVGMVLTDADMPNPHHGHVILGDHAPILVYQIGTHETRILCDVRGAGPLPSISSGAMKEYLLENVLPNMPESLQPSVKLAIYEGKFRTMPNQFLPSTNPADAPDGLILLGDAWNMRHPLTGGGMTVALNDVVLLAKHLAPVTDLGDWPTVSDHLHDFYWERKNLGSVVNILAQALYSLFAADNSNLQILQRGCFEYFKRGGLCVDEPISLLSGILPRPMVLVMHFFAVALYAIRCNFYEKGLVGAPIAFIQAFTALYTATIVILPFMLHELK
ncbi:hypothetical protein DV113_003523 [Geotrichum candidum]|uniref:Squalene monooxygenase n=1 Tax=Geotrichum candidum TaxID=1173061 RepID=A0A0J9XB44_GEOCN|nr:hypothetical protein DV113_003523 [Geotrichum candidum]CDO54503.1 similar to Saccharomyces cerevisiae YGR175C ERG1 Squalene epoxidase [Geotrichum candidum]